MDKDQKDLGLKDFADEGDIFGDLGDFDLDEPDDLPGGGFTDQYDQPEIDPEEVWSDLTVGEDPTLEVELDDEFILEEEIDEELEEELKEIKEEIEETQKEFASMQEDLEKEKKEIRAGNS